MTPEEAVAIRFMLITSDNTDKEMDSACLMAARVEYAISQKTKNLTKDIYENIGNTSLQNYVNPVNYEPINLDTGLTKVSVHTVFGFIDGDVDNYYTETPITYDSKEEENTNFQRIYLCDMVELQDVPCRIVEVDMQDLPTKVIHELELYKC